jgi:hypothetical protein
VGNLASWCPETNIFNHKYHGPKPYPVKEKIQLSSRLPSILPFLLEIDCQTGICHTDIGIMVVPISVTLKEIQCTWVARLIHWFSLFNPKKETHRKR